MDPHRLIRRQRFPIGVEEAWSYFSDPANLPVLTPSYLGMQIVSELPERIYAGEIIVYRVRPILRIPITWVTEITQVDEPRLFVDEQRRGPYRFWHHQHRLREVGGGVEIEDLIHYILPLHPLSAPVHALLVRPQLEGIFDHRRRILEEKFAPSA
jgi:ligand-binding SRPBCC domain-containing protein